jgi:death-on-curing protein
VTEPKWVSKAALMLLVGDSLAEHGGAQGLRDEGLLDSALARPLNLFHYEGVEDIARLAATCCFGVAKNHPFVDGNKRAALIALGLFLKANGFNLTAPQPDTFRTILALAAGELGEEALAAWVARNVSPR